MAKFLGVDTGGTFTDFILFDDESKVIRIHKVLSTPRAPEKAILQGISDLSTVDKVQVDTVQVDATLKMSHLTVIHGSTVATNAILEGKGVRTAYIANEGLADVLTIGRQAREELYNLTPIKKAPLVEQALCLEVPSRLSAQSEHLRQLTEQDLALLTKQLQALASKVSLEAIAINLLFSFFDDSEELKIEQAIVNHFGEDKFFISRSSDVLPEYKEFERGMTTMLNAKVGPLMQCYLLRLGNRLKADIKGCDLSIMQSSGGTISAEQAGRYPVNLLLSGPAGGLKGAQIVAAASGEEKILTFDMGGTSTDVSIIDKEIGFTTGAKIGSYPVAVPMVDMHTIGAGGGSIAQVDAGGLLLVGPESAGADPGPACYGKGGKSPTVTDANVVLGRLLPESFLGGNMKLDKDAAYRAIQTIADALSIDSPDSSASASASVSVMSVEQAAQGIIDVVNDHMVRALRVMSVERGEDPKDFTLVSFGGAGGLHVCALAEELEMTKALVPVNAGVLSALGMLAADVSRERSRTVTKCVKDCDAEDVEQIYEELAAHAKEELNPTSHHSSNNSSFQHRLDSVPVETYLTCDVRYQGQSNTLSLPWQGLQNIEQVFHQKHKDSYGHCLDINVELVNVRVRVIEQRQTFKLLEWEAADEYKQVMTVTAAVAATSAAGLENITVVNRGGLKVGQRIKGPVLILEDSSTTWLAEGWEADVDKVGNLKLFKA